MILTKEIIQWVGETSFRSQLRRAVLRSLAVIVPFLVLRWIQTLTVHLHQPVLFPKADAYGVTAGLVRKRGVDIGGIGRHKTPSIEHQLMILLSEARLAVVHAAGHQDGVHRHRRMHKLS